MSMKVEKWQEKWPKGFHNIVKIIYTIYMISLGCSMSMIIKLQQQHSKATSSSKAATTLTARNSKEMARNVEKCRVSDFSDFDIMPT